MSSGQTSGRQQALSEWLSDVADERTKRYIKERVMGQLEWYQGKSRKSKNRYQKLSTASLSLSGLIPVVSVIADGDAKIKILIAALGAAVTGIGAYLGLQGYKDTWKIYRSRREQLLSILYLYFNRAGMFGGGLSQEECDNKLVETCEKCFQEEGTDWQGIWQNG